MNMIPLIDLQSYNILVTEESVETASLKVIADQICQAFQEVGFVYLKNHGIPRELVDWICYLRFNNKNAWLKIATHKFC